MSSFFLKLLTRSASKMFYSTFPIGFAPGSPGRGYIGYCCYYPKPLVCPEVTVLEALQDICVAAGEVAPVMLVIPVTPAELVDIDFTVDPITVSGTSSKASYSAYAAMFFLLFKAGASPSSS